MKNKGRELTLKHWEGCAHFMVGGVRFFSLNSVYTAALERGYVGTPQLLSQRLAKGFSTWDKLLHVRKRVLKKTRQERIDECAAIMVEVDARRKLLS